MSKLNTLPDMPIVCRRLPRIEWNRTSHGPFSCARFHRRRRTEQTSPENRERQKTKRGKSPWAPSGTALQISQSNCSRRAARTSHPSTPSLLPRRVPFIAPIPYFWSPLSQRRVALHRNSHFSSRSRPPSKTRRSKPLSFKSSWSRLPVPRKNPFAKRVCFANLLGEKLSYQIVCYGSQQ